MQSHVLYGSHGWVEPAVPVIWLGYREPGMVDHLGVWHHGVERYAGLMRSIELGSVLDHTAHLEALEEAILNPPKRGSNYDSTADELWFRTLHKTVVDELLPSDNSPRPTDAVGQFSLRALSRYDKAYLEMWSQVCRRRRQI
eukprot:SAG11_NODE_13159_length_667_cov_1.623239_2_plen_142_part_00